MFLYVAVVFLFFVCCVMYIGFVPVLLMVLAIVPISHFDFCFFKAVDSSSDLGGIAGSLFLC